jgi:hypothetical protein
MPRLRSAAGVLAALLAAGLAVPATASAAERSTTAAPTGMLQGLLLSGGCPEGGSALKNVTALQRGGGLWSPLHLSGADFTDLHQVFLPSEVVVYGEGLKTRHAIPEQPYTRPGAAPADAITCTFEGATKPDGPFQVVLVGTLRGAPASG